MYGKKPIMYVKVFEGVYLKVEVTEVDAGKIKGIAPIEGPGQLTKGTFEIQGTEGVIEYNKPSAIVNTLDASPQEIKGRRIWGDFFAVFSPPLGSSLLTQVIKVKSILHIDLDMGCLFQDYAGKIHDSIYLIHVPKSCNLQPNQEPILTNTHLTKTVVPGVDRYQGG